MCRANEGIKEDGVSFILFKKNQKKYKEKKKRFRKDEKLSGLAFYNNNILLTSTQFKLFYCKSLNEPAESAARTSQGPSPT